MGRPRKNPASGKTALGLVNYLKDTKTPESKLKSIVDWLNSNDPQMDAEELLQYMIESGTAYGTLRKAGKWVRGDSYEPDMNEADKVDPAKFDLLQEELASVKRQTRRLEAENTSLKAQLENIREEHSKLDAKCQRYEWQLKEEANKVAEANKEPVEV